MIKTNQEELIHLSSTFSKLVKRRFGKGPETSYVVSKGTRLYIFMRNFITPAEEVLIENNELNLATTFRNTVINAVCVEFVAEVSKILGRTFDYFFHDWNYEMNTGLLLLEGSHSNEEVKIDGLLEDNLFKLIKEVSTGFHKRPDSLKIVKFTSNMCVVESTGVLYGLKRLLYEQRNGDVLQQESREIKKGYLRHKELFQEVFSRRIEDLFIMWDYENDRNYLIFTFIKEYNMN
nr:DUF2294 domain-containing protein [Neobacillus sp. Marseille-Q6967]